MEEEYGLVLKNSELEQQLGATDAQPKAAAGGGDGRDVADVAGGASFVNGWRSWCQTLCLSLSKAWPALAGRDALDPA